MIKQCTFNVVSFIISGGKYQRFLKELLETQWWPREKILELQWEKFKKLLEHAYKHVPYYRMMFDELAITPNHIQGYGDLYLIPPLTKRDINHNRQLLMASNYKKSELIEDHTGGSTGEPLFFFRDKRFTGINYAHQIRNLMWCGWKEGEPLAYLWGSPIELRSQQRLVRKLRAWLHNEIWLDAFRLTEENMRNFVVRLRKFKPKVLSGYATALRTFALWIQSKGISLYVPAIVSTAEFLDLNTRRLLATVFQAEVFNRFGCREVGNSAHECEAHEGLHINAEHVLVEVVDQYGRPCNEGEIGEILYTNLDNFGFPLIRYKVGDMGVLSNKSCKCGRGLPMIEVVKGRVSDVIRTPKGTMVHGEFFSHLFYGREEIRQFQVCQRSLSAIEIKLVLNPGQSFSEELKTEITNRICDFVGEKLDISFFVVSEIPRMPSGKYKFIISEIDQG